MCCRDSYCRLQAAHPRVTGYPKRCVPHPFPVVSNVGFACLVWCVFAGRGVEEAVCVLDFRAGSMFRFATHTRGGVDTQDGLYAAFLRILKFATHACGPRHTRPHVLSGRSVVGSLKRNAIHTHEGTCCTTCALPPFCAMLVLPPPYSCACVCQAPRCC